MPVAVGQVEQVAFRAVAGAVDDAIDASPRLHREFDETFEIAGFEIRPGDAQTAEIGTELLSLAR